jgi:hypothetical protein
VLCLRDPKSSARLERIQADQGTTASTAFEAAADNASSHDLAFLAPAKIGFPTSSGRDQTSIFNSVSFLFLLPGFQSALAFVRGFVTFASRDMAPARLDVEIIADSSV